jgi:hypothetical protein
MTGDPFEPPVAIEPVRGVTTHRIIGSVCPVMCVVMIITRCEVLTYKESMCLIAK